MPQEGSAQGGRVSHAAHPAAQGDRGVVQVVGTGVGEFAAFDVAPKLLRWVQLGGVAWEPFHAQPVAVPVEVRAYAPTLVGGQLVPDENGRTTGEMAREDAEESEDAVRVAAPRGGAEPELSPPAVPPEPQGHTHQQLLPIERMDQDGRLAARGPRPADRRALREAALVVEENPGAPASGVFFTAGHRVVTQC